MTRQLELVVQGVLGTTPTVSRTSSGRAHCHFRLATTPTFRTPEGWQDDATIWFTAKAWGPTAENLARSLRKGDPVLLVGRFTQERWNSQLRGEMITNVLTVTAGGHDLSRGETRFMKVERAVAARTEPRVQAPSADSAQGSPSPDPDSADAGPQAPPDGGPGDGPASAATGEGAGLGDEHWLLPPPALPSQDPGYVVADVDA